jgi:hypothetical protein
MMGQHARQNELWSEPVNLARRIPADHPLRKLRERVKLDFVREEVAGSYGRKGNVSVDPVIVMKRQIRGQATSGCCPNGPDEKIIVPKVFRMW